MQDSIVHEEWRTISEGECPVDLMGELFQATSENEFLAFTLTAKAFLAMCAFPVKKEVTFFPSYNGKQLIEVEWSTCNDFMELTTTDQCKTFTVQVADTEEIQYTAVPNKEITNYTIDVE